MIEIQPDIVYIEKKYKQTIYSVDDAWFEGVPMSQIEDAAYMSVQQTVDICNEMGLTELITEIDSMTNEGFDFGYLKSDITYLKLLSSACEANKINLALCNFEYFEKEFDQLNQHDNAFLLDINYTLKNEENYGIHLLIRLLQGYRPSAEIVFVTGMGYDIIESTIKDSSEDDSKKWIVRSRPMILKYPEEKLGCEINCFINYWLHHYKSVGLLYGSFVEIVNANVNGEKGKLMHPEGNDLLSDDAKKIHHCIPLINEFLSGDEPDNDSFKALYNAKERKSFYPISQRILEEHFKYIGLNVKEISSSDAEKPIKIPQPGIFFLILLKYFIIHADITVIDNISYDNKNQTGTITLKLREPIEFKIALEASLNFGESIASLKMLLSGYFKDFLAKLKLPKPHDDKMIDWQMGDANKYEPGVDAKRNYHFSGLKYDIEESNKTLKIMWEWE